MTADAYHITSTHPEGFGAAKAMKIALKEAETTMGDVDYINAHGTSTPMGDLSEIRAIKSLAGSTKLKTLISSTKSMTGHLLGAAGAINTVTIDPEISSAMRILLKDAVQAKVAVVLSNTFGFGGHNATLVFGAV